jgi:putative ABC transport system ATP-binding protein
VTAPATATGVDVDVRGLLCSYPTPGGDLTVLDGVDLVISAGSIVAIMGPSGSGKTTLLSVLGGLDRAGAGSVMVAGHDLAQLRSDEMAEYRRTVVGFVFQDFGLLAQLTALENVELAASFGSRARRRRRARARDLLTAVGLAGRVGHRPHELSGGEKQRVAIARALVNEPRLVLADEPTGNLDAGSTASVLEILVRVPREHGCTIVLVTHDEQVAACAQRRLQLVDGRISPA